MIAASGLVPTTVQEAENFSEKFSTRRIFRKILLLKLSIFYQKEALFILIVQQFPDRANSVSRFSKFQPIVIVMVLTSSGGEGIELSVLGGACS